MDVQCNSELRYQETSIDALRLESIRHLIAIRVLVDRIEVRKNYDGRVCNCCMYLPISVGALAKRWLCNVY